MNTIGIGTKVEREEHLHPGKFNSINHMLEILSERQHIDRCHSIQHRKITVLWRVKDAIAKNRIGLVATTQESTTSEIKYSVGLPKTVDFYSTDFILRP